MACAHSPDRALTEIHGFQFDFKHLARQLTAAHTAQKSCRLNMVGVDRKLKVIDGKADDGALVMIEVFECLSRVLCPDVSWHTAGSNDSISERIHRTSNETP